MHSSSTRLAELLTVSDGCAKQAYQTPKLSLFGDVGSLTETGSMNGMEDLLQNGTCRNIFGTLNMTFNMC